MKLDYTSLGLPVTSADVAAYKQVKSQGAIKSTLWIFALFSVFACMIILPLLIQTIGSLSSGNIEAIVPLGALIVPFVLVVIIAVVYSRYNERRRAKLYRFALQNHLMFIENSTYTSYKGMIFDEGYSRVIKQLLRFSDGSEVGNYQYETGSGRSRATHTYGYVKIPLTRNLPHMVLDGKANNLFGIITGMSDSFDRSQKLSLEGDFDKYFTLYAPKEYERDALYVFTPDVMQILIEEGKRYDMEIVDNELFVYSNALFDLVSETQLSSLVKIIETIGSEIRSQSTRYADEKVQSSKENNIVAEKGRRLHKGINLLALVVFGVVVLNIASSVLDSTGSPLGSFIYLGIGIVVLVIACVAFLSRIKLR